MWCHGLHICQNCIATLQIWNCCHLVRIHTKNIIIRLNQLGCKLISPSICLHGFYRLRLMIDSARWRLLSNQGHCWEFSMKLSAGAITLLLWGHCDILERLSSQNWCDYWRWWNTRNSCRSSCYLIIFSLRHLLRIWICIQYHRHLGCKIAGSGYNEFTSKIGLLLLWLIVIVKRHYPLEIFGVEFFFSLS